MPYHEHQNARSYKTRMDRGTGSNPPPASSIHFCRVLLFLEPPQTANMFVFLKVKVETKFDGICS